MAGYSQLFIQKSGIFGASTNTKKFKMGSSNNVYDVNVSLNLGISNRLKLTNKLFLDVELNYKNYFRTYNSNTNLKPFTVNFQTGITYEFDSLK